jgi:hypothetical protein
MVTSIKELSNKLYKQTDIKVSIDTITLNFDIYQQTKSNLEYNPYQSLDNLINELNKRYSKDNGYNTIEKYFRYEYNKDKQITLIFHEYNRPLAKLIRTNLSKDINEIDNNRISKLGIKNKNSIVKEITTTESFKLTMYGLSQVENIDNENSIFDLPISVEYIVNELIGNNDIDNIKIQSIDISQDILYNKQKMLVRYDSKYSISNVNQQYNLDYIDIDKFKPVTYIIPITYTSVIKKIKKDISIQTNNKKNKSPKISYMVSINNNISHTSCNEDKATHYLLKIRDINLYKKYNKYLDDNIVLTKYEFDEDDENLILKNKNNKTSFNTKRYDKIKKDINNKNENINTIIGMEYYQRYLKEYNIKIDIEEIDLLANIKANSYHNRIETICKLNICLLNDYDVIIEKILKELNKIDIVLFKNKKDRESYILKQKNKDKWNTRMLGQNRILTIDNNQLENILNNLFEMFV